MNVTQPFQHNEHTPQASNTSTCITNSSPANKSMTPPKLKRPFSTLKERIQRIISPQKTNNMTLPNGDTNPSNDEKYPRPETTKRRKRANNSLAAITEITMGNMASSNDRDGSKESPIEVDGEEEPAWMANPGPKIVYGKSVLNSRLRNVDLSRNSMRGPKDGPLFGASTSPSKDDLKVGGAMKQTGNGLFNPLPAEKGMEDFIIGAATYTANTSTTTTPLKPNIFSRPRGKPPGLTHLPGTSITPPSHHTSSLTSLPWTSSVPSLNRAPLRALGHESLELVADDSSSCSSDEEDLLGKDNLDHPELDAAYAPLQPTRTPPLFPPRVGANRETEVIHLDSTDSEIASEAGSVVMQVKGGQTFTPEDSPRRSIGGEGTGEIADANVIDDDEGSVYAGFSGSDGGVPLTDAQVAAELGYAAGSDGADDGKTDPNTDAKVDSKAATPGNEDIDLVNDISAFAEEEVAGDAEELDKETIIVTLIHHSHQVDLEIPMVQSFHGLRYKISRALGWDGVGTATMRVWAVKPSSSRWIHDDEYIVKGDVMPDVMQWMHWNLENENDVFFVISDHAKDTPSHLNAKDKKINDEFMEDEWDRFKVPKIFGGDRPEGWTGVNGFLLPPSYGACRFDGMN